MKPVPVRVQVGDCDPTTVGYIEATGRSASMRLTATALRRAADSLDAEARAEVDRRREKLARLRHLLARPTR